MNEKRQYGKILANLCLTLIIILFCIFLLPRLFWFFLPLLIAWCVALIASPLVHFLEKHIKIMRKHGSALIIVLVLALIIGILYSLSAILAHEIKGLIQDFPEIISGISTQLNNAMASLQKKTGPLPFGISNTLTHWDTVVEDGLNNAMQNIDISPISTATSVARNVADIFVLTVFTFIAAYFFTADKDNILAFMRKIIPEQIQKHYHTICDNFTTAIGSYIKAQIKIMVIIYLILLIAFGMLSVRYYALIALLTAFLDFLPLFGTGFIIWPWVAFELFTGRLKTAIFLLFIYLICQITKQVLQPKLVSDGIGLSPLATFLFMFIGYRINGIVGLILGIPIGMILHTFYLSGMFDQQIEGIRILIHDFIEYQKPD